jgi:hypothetical protein
MVVRSEQQYAFFKGCCVDSSHHWGQYRPLCAKIVGTDGYRRCEKVRGHVISRRHSRALHQLARDQKRIKASEEAARFCLSVCAPVYASFNQVMTEVHLITVKYIYNPRGSGTFFRVKR